jgi:hypothetical protein
MPVGGGHTPVTLLIRQSCKRLPHSTPSPHLILPLYVSTHPERLIGDEYLRPEQVGDRIRCPRIQIQTVEDIRLGIIYPYVDGGEMFQQTSIHIVSNNRVLPTGRKTHAWSKVKANDDLRSAKCILHLSSCTKPPCKKLGKTYIHS